MAAHIEDEVQTSSLATALTTRVLHGDIIPPKSKRSRAVAVARSSAGKGISTDLQVKSAGRHP